MRLAAVIALALASAAPNAALHVSSPAFASGAPIPARCSAYGANHSPPLAWTAAPGAKAYALTVRDPDAPGRVFTHWVVWNIPASVTSLGENSAGGGVQGRNDAGQVGYHGPHPPSGVHHYHFDVFALDAPLELASGANISQLEAAMHGHVLASGELIGTYAAPKSSP